MGARIERRRQVSLLLSVIPACGILVATTRAQELKSPRPLVHTHAHNDYEHERPLLDALAHGFCSIEADIHLVEGSILVGHDPEDLRPDRTLEALYLKPLADRVQQNEGRVYVDGPSIILLIDIKTDGQATYQALRPLLDQYRWLLTRFAAGIVNEGAVTVVISGNRPQELIAAEVGRLVAIDGRAADIRAEADLPSNLVPLISDNWQLLFTWRGDGDMPEREWRQLQGMVRRAHDQGRRVRFWATPENERLWATLREAEVDLIGTDDLGKLASFFRARSDQE